MSFTPNNPSSQSSGLPNAYMRYVLYDETGTRAIRSGRVFVTSAANASWEKLEFEYEVPENGLLQVYTANETDAQNVWFDDLKVDFTPQLIVQENHYYPFGMNLAGIEKVGKPEHRFQYNGKEKQEEFGLNWLDYGARNYDATLGRWHSVDLLAEKFIGLSPYHYGYNNPVITINPDGKENIVVIGNDSGKGYKSRLYMKHFVAGAIKRAKTLRKQSLKSHSKEKTTLIMFAQKGQDVSKYVKAASDAGFELQIMSEDKELVEYINNGEQKTDENGKVIKENNRKGDEISNLAFFGHGGKLHH